MIEARPQPVRVLLADDHEIVREGVAQLLDDMPDVTVVGQTGKGDDIVPLSLQLRPDLVVLDYSMPGLDPSVVIGRLLAQLPQGKILILTVHESIHYAVKALENGAHGYVIKSAAVRELMEAVRTVLEGEVYISSQISRRIMQHLRTPKKDRQGLDSLSPREFDMLRALGAGMTLRQSASLLNVSVSTASTYRGRLMEKLSLPSTAALIRFALENEIIG